MFGALWRRLSAPIVAALKHGLSPDKAAWACALGAWIGVIPIVGGTMAISAVAAWRLKLNHVVIQVANYLVFPLQLLLIYPFFKAGVRLFNGPGLGMDPAELGRRLVHDTGPVLRLLWLAALQATAVWALLGLVAVPALWLVFRTLFQRWNRPAPPAALP